MPDILSILPAYCPLPALAPLSASLSLNDLCRNHGAMDRHEYHSRSRSADQRPTIERPTSRSRSTERPHDSSLMRSMPSLPSGRSAPPSPALTRCDPDRRRRKSSDWSFSYTFISVRRRFSGGRDDSNFTCRSIKDQNTKIQIFGLGKTPNFSRPSTLQLLDNAVDRYKFVW